MKDKAADARVDPLPAPPKRRPPSIMVLPQGAELKLRILHSIDRPIDDITVDEICRRCGISRRTFYNHFNSKSSILPWFSGLARTAFIEEIGRSLSLEEGLLRFYQFIYSERDFVMFAAQFDYTVDGLHDAEWDKWRQAYVATLTELHGIKLNEELEALVFGFLTIETAFGLKWVRDGFSIEPEVLVSRMMEFIPKRFARLLDPVSQTQ